MTTLIVTPLDPDAPGSYRQRSAIMRALAAAQEGGSAMIAAYVQVEDLVISRLHTDDGTPVENALEQVSANEFDDLLKGLLAGGEEAVPPPTADS